MNVPPPEWLTRHGGSLRTTAANGKWLVMLDGEPVYWLRPVPVSGKIGCYIAQTNNGQNVPSTALAESDEAAIRDGLEDLRKALGW